MESGYLVMRRQDGNRGEKYVGTVRLVEDDSAVVEWLGGLRERIPLPAPSDITVIPVGSVRYRALRDSQRLEKEFSKSPVPVLVALLEEMGGEATVRQLHDETRSLGLAGEHNSTWWGRTRQRLLQHPRVTESRPNGPLKLIDEPVDPFEKERSLPAREALEFLATPATKRERGLEQALREAVCTGQSELTTYERVAAHALKATLRPWPTEMGEYTPQGASQRVLAMAVEFLADVTKGQRHAQSATAQPSPKLGKAGAPPVAAVTPLLVGLVTTPEGSAAADQAAKLPRGLMAQACVMAVMARFEAEEAGGDHLLGRGAVLLPSAITESPLAPAARREAFAEELLARALGLLLRSAGQRLPSDPECQWVDLVLAAVPEHTLRRGIAAHSAEDLAAALEALADRPDGGRERATLVLESLAGRPDDAEQPESPAGSASDSAKPSDSVSADSGSASAGEASPEEPKTQEPQAELSMPAAPADVDAQTQEPEADGDATDSAGPAAEGPEEEPKAQEPQTELVTPAAPAAPAEAAEAPAQEPEKATDTPADIPEAPPHAPEPTHEERSRHDVALSRERAVAHALRSERDQLKRDLAASERRYERADEEFAELRTRLEAVTAELAAATRRQEALTLQAQRREQELRQARQAGRAASQAQLRQARIDGLRVLATVLSEVADQAAHAADESDPSRALYRRVLTQAATAGLVDIGTSGEETEFDPSRHQAPTGPAERVVVERPGFAWRAGGSQEEVVLLPALVRRAEP
ncbi:hypothetical protein ABZZ36_30375 [Actinacidiphila glaucinigra]|uniref:hypothetical protein n=1 Tax=Actinacidiphila glaucinigra TaxID=235986 RepID=UPI0033A40B99